MVGCRVCLGGVSADEEVALPCGHCFHRGCLVQKVAGEPKCPTRGCRRPFSPLAVSDLSACSVCMSPVAERQEGDMGPGALGCLHAFHLECILGWAARSNTCPLCQTRFSSVYTEQEALEVEQNEARHLSSESEEFEDGDGDGDEDEDDDEETGHQLISLLSDEEEDENDGEEIREVDEEDEEDEEDDEDEDEEAFDDSFIDDTEAREEDISNFRSYFSKGRNPTKPRQRSPLERRARRGRRGRRKGLKRGSRSFSLSSSEQRDPDNPFSYKVPRLLCTETEGVDPFLSGGLEFYVTADAPIQPKPQTPLLSAAIKPPPLAISSSSTSASSGSHLSTSSSHSTHSSHFFHSSHLSTTSTSQSRTAARSCQHCGLVQRSYNPCICTRFAPPKKPNPIAAPSSFSSSSSAASPFSSAHARVSDPGRPGRQTSLTSFIAPRSQKPPQVISLITPPLSRTRSPLVASSSSSSSLPPPSAWASSASPTHRPITITLDSPPEPDRGATTRRHVSFSPASLSDSDGFPDFFPSDDDPENFRVPDQTRIKPVTLHTPSASQTAPTRFSSKIFESAAGMPPSKPVAAAVAGGLSRERAPLMRLASATVKQHAIPQNSGTSTELPNRGRGF